jgi:flavin-binding protein dodecin
MSVARTTEISAAGPSIEEAVRNGVERSCRTLDNVEGVWVKDIKAKIADGRIAEYRVEMKVTFVLDD